MHNSNPDGFTDLACFFGSEQSEFPVTAVIGSHKARLKEKKQ